jgi:pyruvate dehydrogenase E2 component (dihydrolipoamide acetyltransferase)
VQNFVKGVMAGTVAAPAGAAAGGSVGGGGFSVLPWPSLDFSKFGETELLPLSRIKKISGPTCTATGCRSRTSRIRRCRHHRPGSLPRRTNNANAKNKDAPS